MKISFAIVVGVLDSKLDRIYIVYACQRFTQGNPLDLTCNRPSRASQARLCCAVSVSCPTQLASRCDMNPQVDVFDIKSQVGTLDLGWADLGKMLILICSTTE